MAITASLQVTYIPLPTQARAAYLDAIRTLATLVKLPPAQAVSQPQAGTDSARDTSFADLQPAGHGLEVKD